MTAYEMRISNWSSDVCSSDLRRPSIYVDPIGECTAPKILEDVMYAIRVGTDANVDKVDLTVGRQTAEVGLRVEIGCPEVDVVEFGRESCRESVGQYE